MGASEIRIPPQPGRKMKGKTESAAPISPKPDLFAP